jgi:uncharacterized membrane protein YgaE (UPF0421/DUF939 family)
MSGKKNGTFSFFRSLTLWYLCLSIVIFLISAAISSVFGYSLWSWINVLRFILGGIIAIILCLYFFIFKSMLRSAFKK